MLRLQREVDTLRSQLSEAERSRSNTEGQLEQCRQQLSEKSKEKDALSKRLEEQQQQLMNEQVEVNKCRCVGSVLGTFS